MPNALPHLLPSNSMAAIAVTQPVNSMSQGNPSWVGRFPGECRAGGSPRTEKNDLAAMVESAFRDALGLLPEKLAELKGDKLAIVVGILFDKLHLLRSRPTNIRGDAAEADELLQHARRIAGQVEARRQARVQIAAQTVPTDAGSAG
jgi:hypothetical protein